VYQFTTQFTCFTGKKVQTLTPEEVRANCQVLEQLRAVESAKATVEKVLHM
jgi:hypothetical protein